MLAGQQRITGKLAAGSAARVLDTQGAVRSRPWNYWSTEDDFADMGSSTTLSQDTQAACVPG